MELLDCWDSNHWRDWTGYGAFFVVVFLTQGANSLALPRLASHKWFLWSGLIGTSGLLVLWLQTRLSHHLVGPHRIHAEDFGTVDLMSAALEAVVVVSLALMLSRFTRSRPSAALSETAVGDQTALDAEEVMHLNRRDVLKLGALAGGAVIVRPASGPLRPGREETAVSLVPSPFSQA